MVYHATFLTEIQGSFEASLPLKFSIIFIPFSQQIVMKHLMQSFIWLMNQADIELERVLLKPHPDSESFLTLSLLIQTSSIQSQDFFLTTSDLKSQGTNLVIPCHAGFAALD